MLIVYLKNKGLLMFYTDDNVKIQQNITHKKKLNTDVMEIY